MSPFGKNINRKQLIIISLSILVCVGFLLKSIHIYNIKKEYGTPDLRNRIVGSRILNEKEHASPYFYKWDKQDGVRFLDMYDTPELLMNRNTVTPFTLQLLQTTSSLNYSKLTIRWFFAEIISLIVATLLIMLLAKNSLLKLLILGVSLLGIGLSQSWMLHSLSGQVYIFIPLFLASIFFLLQQNNTKNTAIVALLSAGLILIRPTAVLFLAVFVLKSKWKIPVFTFLFLTSYFIFTYAKGSIWLWTDYFKAMSLWSEQSFNSALTKSYLDIYNLKEIEGSSTLTQPPDLLLLEDSSIQGFVFRFLNVQLTTVPLLAIMLCLLTALLFYVRKEFEQFDLKKMLVMAFLLYFISELCIPAVRNSYNAVQWMFPLSLVFLERFVSNSTKLLLLAGGIFAAGIMKFFPFDLFFAELLFFSSCIIYLKTTKVENA